MTLEQAKVRAEKLVDDSGESFKHPGGFIQMLALLLHTYYHNGRRDLDKQTLEEERKAFMRGE